MREIEQVAAVCYRIREGEIEFLLVQTRGAGRWTFPKGGAEAGLTHAQAAAIEALEEAGVHGCIEEAAFALYACVGRGGKPGGHMLVSAHLCEVRRLSPPRETGRNRTWFSAPDAQAKLCEKRKNKECREFLRMLRKAVERIRCLKSPAATVQSQHGASSRGEWNRVEIELRSRNGPWAGNSLPSQIQRSGSIQKIEFADDPGAIQEGEVLPFGTASRGARDSALIPVAKKFKALGTGTRVQ
jgi:ADP-ribose pyrophosphatase YjhB (NUDIX family)